MPGGWADSHRREQLPANWARQIRPAILYRDNYQCTRLQRGVRCPERATDVDHIRPGGPDTPENLTSLCTLHHRQKTAQEGNNARTRQRREAEPHPGVVQ